MRLSRHVAVALVGGALVAIGAVPRVFIHTLPEWLRPFVWSDAVETYVDAGLRGQRLPYFDTAFAYPPVIGYLAGALSLASSDVRVFTAGWGLILAGAAAAVGYLLSREAGPARTLRFWSLAPQLLLLGSLNFDVLPAGCVAVAALLHRRFRYAYSMGFLAAGTASKLFPAVGAPLLALRLWRAGSWRRAVAGAATFGAVLAALYFPSLLATHSSAGFVGAYAVGVRPNIDSPWGLLYGALAGMGLGAADARLVVLVVTIAGFVATYLISVVPRALRATDPVTVLGLAVTTLMLWSRLYSPQYSLWVLPFFVLLALRTRTFALLTLGDLLVFVTVYPLGLTPPGTLSPLELVLATLAVGVVIRHLALFLAWREMARRADARLGSSS